MTSELVEVYAILAQVTRPWSPTPRANFLTLF